MCSGAASRALPAGWRREFGWLYSYGDDVLWGR